jgi:hypothetical protein
MLDKSLPAEFDYTPEQWDQIEACIRQGTRKPRSPQERNALPLPLRDIEPAHEHRRLLREAAAEYHQLLRKPRLSPARLQNRCEKLRRLVRSLRAEIDDFSRLRPFDAGLSINPYGLDGITWRETMRVLTEVEAGLAELSKPIWWSLGYFYSFSGRTEPRVVYIQRVLTLWTLVGGRLQLSNNSGTIGGPLPRFLAAVARPVMGQDTPKPASYRKLIDRQKAFYRKLNEIRAEVPASARNGNI